jgi:hypothetical protein
MRDRAYDDGYPHDCEVQADAAIRTPVSVSVH